LTASDLPEPDREVVGQLRNVYRLMAHSPGASRAFDAFTTYIRTCSTLDRRLQELALIQIGYSTKSKYEYSHHLKIGRSCGLSDAEIHAVARESRGESASLEPLVRTVLQSAREIVFDKAVSADTFAQLQKGLDEAQLVDLIMLMSSYVGLVRFMDSFALDTEPEYLPYLEEFPL